LIQCNVRDQFSRATKWPFGAVLAFILLVVALLMTAIGSTAPGPKYRAA
jgi:putative spermidine/putrescine transport system permease protein